MFEVEFPHRSPLVLEQVIGPDRVRHLVGVGAQVSEELAGRRVVSINSTATGGGVAEMLPVLLAYAGGAAVDGRWLVLEGSPDFFVVTKRLHHKLHGEPGDGGPLGSFEQAIMQEAFASNRSDAERLLRDSDIVLLHDPQPAAMARWLANRDMRIVWRCHIGVDEHNDHTREAWEFLRPLLEPYVDEYVFTRREYAPSWVPNDRLHVIKPSLDPFAPKNRELTDEQCRDILRSAGIIGPTEPYSVVAGDRGLIPIPPALITRAGPAPSATDRLVVQVSRWDPLKDMGGVMQAFADDPNCQDAHLVLAGPDVSSVTDDPEGQQVLAAVTAQWEDLDAQDRARISIVCLPMDDPVANALTVNALQRHAKVVVQKSLKEGFGLTVTEAMFKSRPVVAAAVGGIVDQIRDGVDGVLVDPHDLSATGQAIGELLSRPGNAELIGQQARAAVVAQFMPDSSLLAWADVLDAAAFSEPRVQS